VPPGVVPVGDAVAIDVEPAGGDEAVRPGRQSEVIENTSEYEIGLVIGFIFANDFDIIRYPICEN
jgi:hypothetical protein